MITLYRMATNQGAVGSNTAGCATQTKGWIVLRRPCVMSGRDLVSVPPHPRHPAFDVQRSQIPRPSDRFVTLLGVIAGIAVPGIILVGSDAAGRAFQEAFRQTFV